MKPGYYMLLDNPVSPNETLTIDTTLTADDIEVGKWMGDEVEQPIFDDTDITILVSASADTPNADTTIYAKAFMRDVDGSLTLIGTSADSVAITAMAADITLTIASVSRTFGLGQRLVLVIYGNAGTIGDTPVLHVTVGNAATVYHDAVIVIPECAPWARGSGVLQHVLLGSSVNPTTLLQAELWLFREPPSLQIDNDPIVVDDADLENLVAVLPLDDSQYIGDATADTGNHVGATAEINRPFHTGDNKALYGILVARNAYTPTAYEALYLNLGIVREG
jgi:hypothetical protein